MTSPIFRILTYNVQCGIGTDRVYDPFRIGKWMGEQPQLDVVCCQEIEVNDENQGLKQSVRMGVSHNDNQPKILANALGVGWKGGQHFVVKKLMRKEVMTTGIPSSTPTLRTEQGTASSEISIIQEAITNTNTASLEKWIDAEPAVGEKFGWGCSIITKHKVLQRDAIRIPAQRSTCSSFLDSSKRGLSQAAGMKIEHPVFGKTYIVSLHCMADVLGFAIDGIVGSLQLQNVRSVLKYLDNNIDKADTDNVIIVGDFNSIGGSGVIREMHSYQGEWGPFVDCARCCGDTEGTIPKFCKLRIDFVFLATKSKYLVPISSFVAKIEYSDHFPLTVTFGLADDNNTNKLKQVASSQLCLAHFHRICLVVLVGPLFLVFIPAFFFLYILFSLVTLVQKCLCGVSSNG